MNSTRSTIIRIAAACLGFLLASTSAPAQLPNQLPGYHPQASPYPFAGQPAVDWMAPPNANYDYGGTCCGPHWYDFAVDAAFLQRTSSGFGGQAFTSLGIAGFDPPNVVLSADNLNFDWEAGVRASVRYQMNAVSNMEAVYLDAINWRDSATVTTDNHDLYSVFSHFGDFPLGGFEETDQASLQRIGYESDLDSVEWNWRHAWIKPQYRLSGSWLLGFRYVKLDEQFEFFSQVLPHFDPINMVNRNAASFDYRVNTDNNMYGAQVGTEFTFCVVPAFLFGGEIKAGLFGNRAQQHTTMVAVNPLVETTTEQANDDDVAFLSEASLYGLIQFHPLWKLRAGYQVLYLNGVALGINNFNPQPPFLGTAQRVPGQRRRRVLPRCLRGRRIRLVMIEPYGPRVLLLPGSLSQRMVQLRPAGPHPTDARAARAERWIKVRDHHVVGSLPGLGQNAAVGIQNHGISGADLIVVRPDTVAENVEQAVVVGPRRQPTHEPATAFVAAQFGLDRGGVLCAVVPELPVNHPHRIRAARVTTARLMRSQHEIRSCQRADAHVFDDVVVVADQHRGPPSAWQFHHREVVAGSHVRADKAV